ncbi:MAG: XrtA system polysaccharide deacetylase [Alphaproteobacteria bacterium]
MTGGPSHSVNSPYRVPHFDAPLVNGRVCNAMSIDVEDYFQVQAFDGQVHRNDWENMEWRFVANTHRILDMLAQENIKATFFTLGWIAQRAKPLIRRITGEGHELASHGMAHFRADEQTPDAFRRDIAEAKSILEDIGGAAVTGYRAATFSIGARNMWAFDVLAEEGYRYSSSINPVQHDLYGLPDAPRAPFYPRSSEAIPEIPITTVHAFGRNLPFGGGGFFRLLPYAVFHWGLKRVNDADGLACIYYMHPWEIDPDQPRIANAPFKSRVRHYLNLARTEPRLRRLLKDFAWDRVDRVYAALLDTGLKRSAND